MTCLEVFFFFLNDSVSFGIRVECTANYYSQNCNVKCIEQNSCSGGHFTCDKNTGDKLCMNGFIDPTTNCVNKNQSIQICHQSDGKSIENRIN